MGHRLGLASPRLTRLGAAVLAVAAALLLAAHPGIACGPNPPNGPKNNPPLTFCPVKQDGAHCPCTGSPCYVRAGSFTLDVEDLSIPTPGFPLRISRYYESARAYDGPLGHGWTLNLPTRIFYSTYKFTAPSTWSKEADITMPTGDRLRFTENADGSYTPPPIRHDTLIKNADSSFDLTLQLSRRKYHFSSTGSITMMTDEYGNVINLTYDGNGRLQTVSDGAGSGRSLTVTWGADGRISSIQDSASRVVQYSYTNGNLTTVTDLGGRATTYSYELTGSGWLLQGGSDQWGRSILSVTYDLPTCHVISASTGGESFDYNYNTGVSNMTAKTEAGTPGQWEFYFTPDGWITDRVRELNNNPNYHTDYYADGSVQQTIDEVGVKTYYTYNASGYVLTVTRDYQGPDAIRFDYAYDPNFPDRVISITPKNPSDGSVNHDWQAWQYDYYQSGATSPGSLYHVYRVKDDGTTLETLATYTYNAKGQVTEYTSATGGVTDYTYDANWNLWTVKGPANNDGGTRPVTTYGYDSVGRVTSVQDALGNTTSYQYDNLNRVTSVTLPKPTPSSSLVFTTTYSYDNYDSVTGLTFTNTKDPNGQITGTITKQGSDAFGRLVESIDAQSHTTSYGYTNGLLTSITDANGNVVTYDYDRLARRMIDARFPNGAMDSWQYNDDGTLAIFYSRDGWRRNTYDNLKRVTRRDSGAPYFNFTFVGQKVTEVDQGDGYGWTQSDIMTYDHSYRVNSVSEGTRGTITRTYNTDDTVASYTVTGGPAATYAYYPDGSLDTISWSPIAGQFKYLYTLTGQYQNLTYPNGGTRAYTYDNQGRLTNLTNHDPVAGNLAIYAYGYDYNYTTSQNTMLGQRTSLTATVPAQSLNNHLFKYEYDPSYELTKVTYPNVAPFSGEIDSWTYDAIGNRLTNTVNGTTQTYAYEQAAGHQGQRLTSDGVNTYTYNGYTGSTGSRSGPGGNFTFTWTPWGEMSQINSGNLADYYYDYQGRRFQKNSSGTVSNYLYDGLNLIRDVTGSTTTDYLFGPGIDEPIALSRGGQGYYFAVDGLGSVTLVDNSSGTVQNNYLYDAWGATRNTPGSFVNIFGYTARETGEAGLNYYRARYYQPGISRFVSEDPMQASASISNYAYVKSRPLIYSDPLGLFHIVESGRCKGRIQLAFAQMRKAEQDGKTCACSQYARDHGRDFGRDIQEDDSPPYIYVLPEEKFPPNVQGTSDEGRYRMKINEKYCSDASVCAVGGLLLHELLHEWRGDTHKTEDPKGFSACTFGCFNPGQIR